MSQSTFRQTATGIGRRGRLFSCALAWATLIVVMTSPAAWAQDDAPMPPEVIAEIGPAVVAVLEDDELAKLAKACPESEPAALVECLRSNRRARRLFL